jgi:hypothetical protein
VKLVIVLLAFAGLMVACERVVDLTPPDANTDNQDAAVSAGPDASLPDAGSDGNDALPPDAAIDAL